jgi:enoyl-CoA hydratase/carnithine racemase
MDDILTDRSEGILRIELNRPSRKNALTSTMYLALADAFEGAVKDDSIRVVLWHGAGDCFCAGNDVEDFLRNPPGSGESPQARLMQALIAFDKPLIAAVHGAAIGGGTTMLTHCDLVYASESARFQTPFVDLALVPEFGSSYSLAARIGYVRAAEIILLGSSFNAAQALEFGFVNHVVPDDKLLVAAIEAARKFAAKPGVALRAAKRLMKQPFLEQLRSAIAAENTEFSKRVRSADAKEAFAAFLEKRPPHFQRASKSGTAE